jgi:hypothetical protein
MSSLMFRLSHEMDSLARDVSPAKIRFTDGLGTIRLGGLGMADVIWHPMARALFRPLPIRSARMEVLRARAWRADARRRWPSAVRFVRSTRRRGRECRRGGVRDQRWRQDLGPDRHVHRNGGPAWRGFVKNVIVVERCGESAGDRRCEGAILREGLGRDQDQPAVGLAGGAAVRRTEPECAGVGGLASRSGPGFRTGL